MKKAFALICAALACVALRAGDMSAQPARHSPDWFAKGLIYQVQLRSFSPEGTLKGAEARLPHLKDLGVTAIYLGGKAGYAVKLLRARYNGVSY